MSVAIAIAFAASRIKSNSSEISALKFSHQTFHRPQSFARCDQNRSANLATAVHQSHIATAIIFSDTLVNPADFQLPLFCPQAIGLHCQPEQLRQRQTARAENSAYCTSDSGRP